MQALLLGLVLRSRRAGLGRQDFLIEHGGVDVLDEAALLGQDRRRAGVDLGEAAIDEEFLAVAVIRLDEDDAGLQRRDQRRMARQDRHLALDDGTMTLTTSPENRMRSGETSSNLKVCAMVLSWRMATGE